MVASNNHYLARIRHLLYHSTTNSYTNDTNGNLVNVVTLRSSALNLPILRNETVNDSLAHHNSQVNMAMKQLEEAEKQGHVINLNKKEKDLSTKNSKVFFSSLQEEVKTHVREKASDKKRKDRSKHINVASLKL